MAMRTTYTRADGTQGLPLDASGEKVGWSLWHCARLADAIQSETGEDSRFFVDSYTFIQDHIFIEDESRIWDKGGIPGVNYIFNINVGDTYHCYRD